MLSATKMSFFKKIELGNNFKMPSINPETFVTMKSKNSTKYRFWGLAKKCYIRLGGALAENIPIALDNRRGNRIYCFNSLSSRLQKRISFSRGEN